MRSKARPGEQVSESSCSRRRGGQAKYSSNHSCKHRQQGNLSSRSKRMRGSFNHRLKIIEGSFVVLIVIYSILANSNILHVTAEIQNRTNLGGENYSERETSALPSRSKTNHREPLRIYHEDASLEIESHIQPLSGNKEAEKYHKTIPDRQDVSASDSNPRDDGLPPRQPNHHGRQRRWAGSSGAGSIPAFLGQRLVIPCTNSSASLADVTDRAGQLLSAAPARRTQNKITSTGALASSPNGQGISLIAWYKDDPTLDSPIYTVDARGASELAEAKQQTGSGSGGDSLRGRAHFEESKGSAPALIIDEATGQDAGLYTCTIEFYAAPTQAHKIRVQLMNPPHDMVIRDEATRQPITGTIVGPYDEDSPQTFVCEAESGDPAGQVSWWQLESISDVAPKSPQRKWRNKQATGSAYLGDPTRELRYLTTVSQADQQDELVAEGESQRQTAPRMFATNYFVALHSSQLEQLDIINNLVLPFPSERVKLWRKLGQNSSAISSAVNLEEKLVATLQVPMSRSNFGDEFLCLASNNDYTVPLNSSIKINMNLKPTEVRILNKTGNAFKLDHKVVVQCQVQGSRPSAKIRWFRGAHEIESLPSTAGSHIEVPGDTATREISRDLKNWTRISYLTLVPKLSDHEKQLTCSAHNPHHAGSQAAPALSDSITMNVQYPPILSLKLAANFLEESIKIDSDIIMDCNVQSNPPIEGDIIWLHNDRTLQDNSSAGIIMSKQSLVIQRIQTDHRGKYQCLARNSIGESRSNMLELKPKFKPICDNSRTISEYKVAVNQAARIECHVLAEPADDLTFTWLFNQSSTSGGGGDETFAENYHLEEMKQYETNFASSSVTFTPKSRRHYGTLLCSARNPIDKQDKPCVIRVLPSEIPDPVYSCFFDNKTPNSFSVHCQAPATSQPGGGRLSYLLELFTNEASNSSSESTAVRAINKSSQTAQLLRHKQKSSQTAAGEELEGLTDEEDDEDNPGDLMNDDGSTGNSLRLRKQRRVRKIASESPTFQVDDLEPNTNYNVLVYVQNSKGLSPPASYLASTLPGTVRQDGASGEDETNFGRAQLYPTKMSSDSQPFHERLKSFLRFRDYMNAAGGSADNPKPMIGIALAVVLCCISLVLVAFLVSRSCRGTSAGEKRRGSSQKKSFEPKADEACADGVIVGKQTNQFISSSSSSSRTKSFPESGSDTSRETNTDSTLVSSPRPAESSSVAANDGGSTGQWAQPQTRFLTVAGNPSQPSRVEQQPLLDMMAAKCIYTSARHNQATGVATDPAQASQHSIQSGSDYTPSNNADDRSSAPPAQLDDRKQQALLLSSYAGLASEPVYVIGNQASLCDRPAYWGACQKGRDALEAALSLAGTMQTTGGLEEQGVNRCQLIGGKERGPQQQFSLPNSMSIPVSLSDNQAREHQHQQHQQFVNRRYSQEFPMKSNDNLCEISPLGVATSGSYLTLVQESSGSSSAAVSGAPNMWQPAYGYCYSDAGGETQQLSQNQAHLFAASISPPDNFANNGNYCFSTLDSATSGRRRPGCLTKHRVKPVQGVAVLTQPDGRQRCASSGAMGDQTGRQQRNRVKFQAQQQFTLSSSSSNNNNDDDLSHCL